MKTSVDLRASFRHCRRIAKTRARNFYYSFLLLDRERKDAMCAIYAFMRFSDDLSDETAPPAAERKANMAAWRAALERALAGDVGADPILPAFRATVEKYRIPHEYFYDLIEGVASDLEPRRFETQEQLYRYCYQVASVVGLTTIHIFGFEGEQALAFAEKCGQGFQLTNILRDLGEDAEMGRVYLPDEDLARFGLDREQLLANPGGDDRFRRLMAFEWDRANTYYRQAAPLLQMVDRSSRPALWAMMTIYHGVLLKIRDLDYDVYRTRARLTSGQKLTVVARAAGARFLGAPLSFSA